MELTAIGPDLYACLQPDTGFGASNSGLVARGGGLVVDTFWDLPRTRALMDAYATVLPEPASRLLNTHHNGDHCWGNQLYVEAGTEIIGHRRCAEYMSEELAPEVFVALCAEDDIPPHLTALVDALRTFDFRGVVVTPPTTLIDDDTTIDLDGLAVDLLYVGPAHTAGDVIAHVPEAGVVFTGDVLFHECTPIGWQGTFANWIAALDRIVDLAPAVVVPGHGPLATVDGVVGLRDYLTYVWAEAEAGHRAGRTTLETAQGIELGPYAGWTEPERVAFQVDRAFRELDGAAWDAPGDLMKILSEMAVLREGYAS
jgi:glyoxylase-like metal-dependent hydrolase (beta-lactamase superfamily II)